MVSGRPKRYAVKMVMAYPSGEATTMQHTLFMAYLFGQPENVQITVSQYWKFGGGHRQQDNKVFCNVYYVENSSLRKLANK